MTLWRHIRNVLLIAIVCAVAQCSHCGGNVAGTTTETQTGRGCAIKGWIVFSDNTAAAGTDVLLHDSRGIRKIVLGKTAALVRNDSTRANINGFFRIDSVDTGKYYVEFNYRDSLGAVDSTTIQPADTAKQVNAQLGRDGSVAGTIDHSLISARDTTWIYVRQLDRLVRVDSTGAFTIPSLPPGTYAFRIVAADSVVHSPLDTAAVPVAPGRQTTLTQVGGKFGTVIITGTVQEQP